MLERDLVNIGAKLSKFADAVKMRLIAMIIQVIIIPNINLIIPVRVLIKVDFNILYPLRCKLKCFYYLCTLKGII